MSRMTINHRTVYRYPKAVRFGDHRLMVRPRDSHDLRLVRSRLRIVPQARIRWLHDVFGNSVAVASFDQAANELLLESTIVIDHYGLENPEFPVEPYARSLPFSYAAEEARDLSATVERHSVDPRHQVDAWAQEFLRRDGPTDTVDLLIDMTRAIRERFTYEQREEPGVRSPVDTLELSAGSCRDFAYLMMEAARSLGLAARFVTGYLYDPALDRGEESEVVGAGSTHAWAQVYLPGAGWVEFDPTNGSFGGTNLIRIGVARDPGQAVPVQGTFFGDPGGTPSLSVEVKVTAEPRVE